MDWSIAFASFALVSTLLYETRYFLKQQESRDDLVPIHDLLLERFPLADTSWHVNILTYISYILYMFYLLHDMPYEDVTTVMMQWILLSWCRVCCRFLCPLKVNPEHFPLIDPLAAWALHNIELYDQDLFFSGHISTLCMMGYTAHAWIFHYIAFLISILMLFSKVHYSIDLFTAPFMTYGCYVLGQGI